MEKKTKIKILIFVVLFIILVIVVKTAERNGYDSSGQKVPFYKIYDKMNTGILF